MSKEQKGCLSSIFPFLDKQQTNHSLSDRSKSNKLQPEDIYRLRDDFLSPAEFSFYKVAKSLMKEYFVICPKVSLSDLFYVTHPQKNMAAYNRINRKHVDFVICDPLKMLPLFAIELDDKSHQKENRRERDRFVDTVFAQAELPLIHIPAQHTYNQQDLGIVFKQALSRSRNYQAIQTANKANTQNETRAQANPPVPASENPTTEKEAPFCPKCGVQMTLREARQPIGSAVLWVR
ncbi:MAG: topoisomerase [Anaerolineaceae bacterium]|nr:topoisomerase [Anaerolineaceae bacterium]